jgi:propionate CoA-transferase
MKLGEALEKRGVAPHIFQSAEEAQLDLDSMEEARSAGGAQGSAC